METELRHDVKTSLESRVGFVLGLLFIIGVGYLHLLLGPVPTENTAGGAGLAQTQGDTKESPAQPAEQELVPDPPQSEPDEDRDGRYLVERPHSGLTDVQLAGPGSSRLSGRLVNTGHRAPRPTWRPYGRGVAICRRRYHAFHYAAPTGTAGQCPHRAGITRRRTQLDGQDPA